MSENDPLARYAYEVTTLRDQKRERVDQSLLDAIAEDLGLTESDLVAVRREADMHKVRGATFRRQSMIDEAIRELDAAVSLAPLDPDAQLRLADALHTRAMKVGSVDDHARALLLVESCLAARPDDTTAAGLANAMRNNDPSTVRRSSRGVVVALASALAAIGGALAWWLLG